MTDQTKKSIVIAVVSSSIIIVAYLFFHTIKSRDINEKIKGGIEDYYREMNLPDYEFISNSKLDTLQHIPNIKTTARVVHSYKAAKAGKEVKNYTDTLELLIYSDYVVVRLPEKR